MRWESWVQDIGPPEISQLHITSNGESTPRDLHLSAKTQLHSTISKLQCWTPHAKQQDRNTTPPISREVASNHNKVKNTQKNITECGSAHQRQDPGSSPRTQAPVPSTRKPTQPTEPNLPTGGRHQKQWELWSCSLWKGDPKHSKLSKMKRQRNTQQMKEQGKNPPDQTNEEGIGSLPEKEFRVMIVKMI